MKKITLIIIIFTMMQYLNGQYHPIVKYDKIKGNLIGYIDSTGKIIIEPSKYVVDIVNSNFNLAGKNIKDFDIPNWAYFHNGYVTLMEAHNYLLSKRYSYMVLDKNLDTIFAPQEDQIYAINDGIAILKHYLKNVQKIYDSTYHFIKLDGTLLNNEEYTYVSQFNNGYALVSQSNNEDDEYRYFFIDKNGKKVGKNNCPFDNGYESPARVMDENGWWVFNEANIFCNGYATVKNSNGNWYSIDTNFNSQILTNSCYNLNSFTLDGVARVLYLYDEKVKYGFINTKGISIIDTQHSNNTDNYIEHCIYDYANHFSDGLALVKKNNHCGYIDINGQLIIEYKYLYANDFHNGLAPVYDNGSWCYVDKKGSVVIDGKYDYAWPFYNGLAKIQKNNKIMYINRTGKIIYEFE